MPSDFSVDFLQPTSDFQMHITFLLVDKNTIKVWVFNFLMRSQGRFWYIKLSGFAEIFTFSTPAPVVSVLVDRHSDRERHAPCAIVPLKTEMSHRFLQWMRPGLFPIFTIIFGTK